MRSKWLARWFVMAAVFSLAAAGRAFATPFSVTLDTSALAAAPGILDGPFSLFFQLTDGSGTNDGNNTATLSDFTFGGGSATTGAAVFGGASGDLDGGIVLTDSSFLNFAAQGFTPGGSLSFLLDMSTNVDAGGVPDVFAFSILDSSGALIPTLDPTFADTLLTVNIDSQNPTFLTYAADLDRTDIALAAPQVEPVQSEVPEPASLLLMGTGFLTLTVSRMRRSRKS
jgi:PEP-CTERM motif-containing protein